MPAIRGFVLALAAAAAVLTFDPRVLGQAAQNDPAAQIQLAVEHFDAARYREAMDAYDLAIQANDADLALRARKGKIRSGLRIAEFELARLEAETLVKDAPRDAEAQTLLGDAMWAAMLMAWIGAAVPHVLLSRRAVIALALCTAVEVSQLAHAPLLDAMRRSTMGHLVLGNDFDVRDLGSYALGVAGAALLELVLRRRRPAPRVAATS